VLKFCTAKHWVVGAVQLLLAAARATSVLQSLPAQHSPAAAADRAALSAHMQQV
jgi:hypothetical protein